MRHTVDRRGPEPESRKLQPENAARAKCAVSFKQDLRHFGTITILQRMTHVDKVNGAIVNAWQRLNIMPVVDVWTNNRSDVQDRG